VRDRVRVGTTRREREGGGGRVFEEEVVGAVPLDGVVEVSQETEMDIHEPLCLAIGRQINP
jgi:hypothetical protein